MPASTPPPTTEKHRILPAFGVLMEEHRYYSASGQIPAFQTTPHGYMRPVVVSYDRDSAELINVKTGQRMMTHPRHRFFVGTIEDLMRELILNNIKAATGSGVVTSRDIYNPKAKVNRLTTLSKALKAAQNAGLAYQEVDVTP